MRNQTGRGYGSTPGATTHEQRTITRLAEAERRVDDPWVLDALGDGLDLLRQLIAERGQRQNLDDEMDAARAEPAEWSPPCPDFEPDPPAPDL